MIQSSVTIASILPFRKTAGFPWSPKRGGNWHEYVLEAGTAEKPSTLVVEDAFEYPFFGGDIGRRETQVSAESIADNLIDTWAGRVLGREGEIGPGIFRCAGDTPTKEEIDRASRLQFAWCRNMFRAADELVKLGRWSDITDMHRFAARYIGQQPEWLREVEKGDVKDCPFCGEQIKATAVKCKHCGSDLTDRTEQPVPAAVAQPPIKPPIQVRK